MPELKPEASIARCDYCDLPLRRGHVLREGRSFCCYGCYLVDGISGTGAGGADSGGDHDANRANWILVRVLIASFLAMGVMVFSIVLYSSAVFSPEGESSHPLGPLTALIQWITMAFAAPAVALLGWPLLRQSIGRSVPSPVDALVAIGSISAFILSVINVIRGEGEVYLETAVMLLLLVTVGRYLEARARARAGSSIRGLLSLVPTRARRHSGEIEESVPVEEVLRGEVVRVLAGEGIPVDGEVIRGHGVVDTSMVSGESEPRELIEGDAVYCGTTCLDGVLDIRVTGEIGDRLVDRMVSFVAEARERRPGIERLAERVSWWFLPTILAVALGTFVFWYGRLGPFDALLNGLAVLLIACPCALGIAAPLAISMAMSGAARKGILIRRGEILEALRCPGRLYFDKTGTLTHADLEISEVNPSPGRSPEELRTLAASIAAYSTHPVSRALASEVTGRIFNGDEVRVENRPGHGFLLVRGQERYVLGSRLCLEQEGISVPGGEPGGTDAVEVHIGREGEYLGNLLLRERIREEAKSVIRRLEQLGWKVTVLTGDRPARGEALGRRLGVEVKAGLLPQDKVEVVASDPTARLSVMVGDGLNDAPVLAAAGVGISLSSAADMARDVSDVILLDAKGARTLDSIPYLLELSRQTLARVRWNLFWAFGYNSVGCVLAASGHVHPILAAVLMIISSLSVVATSVTGAPSPADHPGEEIAAAPRDSSMMTKTGS